MSEELFPLDDAAAAALWELARARVESIGLLYEVADEVRATDPQSREHAAKARGRFEIPKGSLRGLFHNHPPMDKGRRVLGEPDFERARFSRDDIAQARALGVPSYIGVGRRVFRFDPKTGRSAEVLAEIPLEPIRRLRR